MNSKIPLEQPIRDTCINTCKDVHSKDSENKCINSSENTCINSSENKCINTRIVYWESDMPAEDIRRFSRQIIVPNIWIEGQKRLKAAKVLIVGMGGLGSPVLTYLAMSGIGEIGIVDFDRVEIHNLQRQSAHNENTIGEYKTRSAAEFASKLNSRVIIREHNVFLDETNICEILSGYDVIVDCCDQIRLRYTINDWSRMLQKDLVSGSVLRWEGQINVIPRDGSCYRCVFPEMKERSGSCDTSGVVGSMCGVIGSIQATEVIKMIINRPSRSKMIVYNGYQNRQNVFEKNYKKCIVCNENMRGLQSSIISNSIEDANGFRTGDSTISQRIPKNLGPNNKIDQKSCKICPFNKPDQFQAEQLEWKNILEKKCLIIDIRTEVHYRMFRVKNSLNIQEYQNILRIAQKNNAPIAITCYRGNSSREYAYRLMKDGIEAYSAKGGIEGFKELIGFDGLE